MECGSIYILVPGLLAKKWAKALLLVECRRNACLQALWSQLVPRLALITNKNDKDCHTTVKCDTLSIRTL